MENSGRKKSAKKARSDNEVSKKLFKFQCFAERLANIRINVTHRVGSITDTPEDQETFFHEALLKWKELNCTLDFVNFLREVQQKTNSLAQLVHHKDEVVGKLKQCLTVKNTLAYEPLLDLLVQLARDLQGDFYPHFVGFFPLLVTMCDTQDTTLIQCVFTCLTYLFKFLWRHMLKDLENVYQLYSQLLLESQKTHIRQFAVESFSFLLRKVRDRESLVEMIFRSLSCDPGLCDGIGRLMFEVCKGVSQRFHSCCEWVWPLLLSQLGSPELHVERVAQALGKMVELMAEHTRKEYADPVWQPLLDNVDSIQKRLKDHIGNGGGVASLLCAQLNHTLYLIGIMVSWRNGFRITNKPRLFQSIFGVLGDPHLPGDTFNTALHLAASLILVSPDLWASGDGDGGGGGESVVAQTLQVVCGKGEGQEEVVRLVIGFFQELTADLDMFMEHVLSHCLQFCELSLKREENVSLVLKFLTELCLLCDPKTISDFSLPSAMLSTGFTLNLEPLMVERTAVLPRKRTLRKSTCRPHPLEDVGVAMVLVKSVELGVDVLQEYSLGALTREDLVKGQALQKLWCALVCLQYVRPVSDKILDGVLELYNVLKRLCQDSKDQDSKCGMGQDNKDQDSKDQDTNIQGLLCFVLSQTLSSVVGMVEDAGKLGVALPLETVLDTLKLHPSSLPLLVSAFHYLTVLASSEVGVALLSADCLEQLLPVFSVNMASPYSSVRLLTLQILALFNQPSSPVSQQDHRPVVNTLAICLGAEQIPASLQQYRERVIWLQKLTYRNGSSSEIPETCLEVALRYLIGSLYVNFNLLWEPLIEVISSYAVEENTKVFWRVLAEMLDAVTTLLESGLPHQDVATIAPAGTNWYPSISALFWNRNGILSGAACRIPDHANHRRLLWQCMSGLPQSMTEPRSRVLVPFLFRFIKNEYSLREDSSLDEFQDLRKVADSAVPIEEDGLGEEMEGVKVQGSRGVKTKGVVSGHGHISSKKLTQTLVCILQVFTAFRNPKHVYKQDDMWGLYMKLLIHKQSEVQTLALAGLMTFKPPYLLPYKENFERLLEDSSFREELVNFRMDSEVAVVSSEHRENLLPVLTRVLYGRMQRQGGHSTTKAGGAGRRGLVLRFLGDCEGSELTEFVKLLTLPFRNIISEGGVVSPVGGVATDVCRVVPLKRQQGFLNMVGQMVSTLGPKLLPHLVEVLGVITHLGGACSQLLEQRHLVQPHHVNALKILRQLALTRLTQCFETFLEFDFSPLHERVLTSFVWPHLTKLPHENIQSPTSLLRLLSTWSAYPQYWSLLAEKCATPSHLTPPTSSTAVFATPPCHIGEGEGEGEESVILKYVFECLSSPKSSVKVCVFVMEMAVNLLTLGEGGGEGGDKVVMVQGEGLVGPYVPILLRYLNHAIGENVGRGGKVRDKGRSLQCEFVVLSRISSVVGDPEECSVLVGLLLPFLSQRSGHYKSYEESILQSLENLVLKTSSMSQFIRPLAQLFGILTDRTSRSKLCSIFQKIAQKHDQWTTAAEIVTKLNSWNSRLIDEPDYDKRLEGFSEAKQMLVREEGGVVEWTSSLVDLVYPILQTALFYLIQCSDMSIRDLAASFISELITKVSPEDKDAFRLFVLTSLVVTVKQGLRSNQDFARRESVDALSRLVRAYSRHPKFADLACLCHEDPEADFFSNVQHIQLHRRTRAFRKLAKSCSEGMVGQGSCLEFLLPLANRVVFAPTTNTEQNLVAEAVGVVGAVARLLSWTNYSFVLGHYLRQLAKSREFQRNLIKVVIAVLDNFHFDLSMVTSEVVADANTKSADSAPCGGDLATGDNGVEVESGGAGLEPEEREEPPCVLDTEGAREGPEVEEAMEEPEVEDKGKSRNLAQKIYRSIVSTILPSLQQVLTRKIEIPGHKLSHQEQDIDSEVLRVPVAMAMTKLLLALPEEQLHANLPNLLLKVCLTLKNRSRDIRDVGRNTLVKMASSLGPKYLNYIIKEMKDSLTRGYMLHVLSYSLHYLLRAMSTPPTSSSSSPSPSPSSPLAVGDLDPCLEQVSGILVEDLFGTPAEERESTENIAKIPESKTPQSYNSYEIVSRFLSPRLLPDLLVPVKEVLETRCNSRTSRVVEEVFRRVAVGIQGNHGFTPRALLVFVYEVLSDSIPQLASKPKPKLTPKTDYKLRPPDHRLLPPAPERSGPRPINLGNVGASIVTEFGLQLLHVSLKHGKFDMSDNEQLQMLDPFVSLLHDSLSSPHPKVVSRTLHCLVWAIRLPLPSLETLVDPIALQLFGLLRRYARGGMATGNNRELVLSSFKAMTVIVRDFKKHAITEDELRILLSFVEEDIHDYQRQSTAFPLLKAILSRKLVVSEIYEIMQKVTNLSLTSDSEHVRLQCRQAVLQFLMDYPLGKKLNTYFDFHVTNLNYEEQSGRESMLEQLNSIFTKFPPRLVNRHSAYFFVPLSLRLLNEESPTCLRMVSAAIKTLLGRLDTERSNEAALIIETWLKEDQILHKRLGVLALGLLVEAEPRAFLKRIPVFLPLVHSCLLLREVERVNEKSEGVSEDGKDEGSGAENGPSGMDEGGAGGRSLEGKVRAKDRLLFSTLSTLNKMCVECELLGSNSSLAQDMDATWDEVCSLLLHPHSWVRLSSARLLGLLFASCPPDDIVSGLEELGPQEEGCGLKRRRRKRKKMEDEEDVTIKASYRHYLLKNTLDKVQEICGRTCMQFSSPLLNAELANQVVKNLVFLSRVLHRLQLAGKLQPGGNVGGKAFVGGKGFKGRPKLHPRTTEDKVQAFEKRTLMMSLGASSGSDHEEEEEEGEGEGKGEELERVRDLQWLIRRMSRLASYEAGRSPKDSIKRTHILQWIAAVSLDLGPASLPAFLPHLLPPLHRELTDSDRRAGQDLHTLALEVVELVKGVCGKDIFSSAYARVQKSVAATRERRRGQAALEAVLDPEKMLFKKKKKNELKKASKKRRVTTLRPDGTAAAKRRRKL